MTDIHSNAEPVGEPFDPFGGGALRVAATTGPQREIWSLAQLGPDASRAYNEGLVLRLRGAVDIDALRRALAALIARHDALRASFSPDGREMIVAEEVPLALTVLDIDGRDADATDDAVRLLCRHEMATAFDLVHGPLVRVRLLRAASDDVRVILVAHHIVCDGWSFGVLVEDLATLYALETGGQNAGPLPPADSALVPPSVPAANERGALTYWSARFANGAPVLDLPTDRVRPSVRTFDADRVDHVISADVLAELRATSRAEGVTLFTTLFSAWAALLARLSGSDDLVVGIAAAGQASLGREGMVGHAVTVLPVRTRVALDRPLGELAKSAHDVLLDAFDHQDLSYGALLEQLPLVRDPSRPPLVQVLFNLDRRLPLDSFQSLGLAASVDSIPRTAEAFELFLNVVETGDGLICECQFNTALFDAAGVRARLEAFEQLLRARSAGDLRPIAEVPLASEAMRAQLATWGRGATQPVPSGTAADLVRAQVQQAPNGAAVRAHDGTLTYQELDAAADRLAAALRRRGIGTGARVALWLDRGVMLPVALLGVMRAGAAFVPLDPRHPTSRTALILEDAAPMALLSAASAPPSRDGMATFDLAALVAEPIGEAALPAVDGATPAYVLYTSGSTGKPKGVVVSHRALVNFLCAMQRVPGLDARDVLLAVTTLSFDIALLELLLPLTVGAQLRVATSDDAADGNRLSQRLAEGVTVMQATPSTWRMLRTVGWTPATPGFRAFCGGEALPADLAGDLLACGVELWNLYGPTEATIWATVTQVTEANGPIAIGQPIDNTSVCVLDAAQQPVPPGVPGELCIGGVALADGYLGAPELTAARFFTLPGAEGAARWYRTGDAARWLSDGRLLFEGRGDGQVKLRGHRIELGEVETAARRADLVADAAAMVQRKDAGDDRLILWVKVRDGAAWNEEAVRTVLRAHLPVAMQPSFIGRLDALPMTPNGKLDRKALPIPADHEALTDEPPATDTERLVAAAFRDVLGVPRVGRFGNFFSLGGHSLLATRVVQRVRADTGVSVALRDFFAAPTVASLAQVIEQGTSRRTAPPRPRQPGSAIVARSWGAVRPLSLTQERIWFAHSADPRTTVFNLPSSFWLLGPLDVERLAAAFSRLVARHDVLRSTIREVDGVPRQVIAPPSPVHLAAEVMPGATDGERREAARTLVREAAREPFDLSAGPLWRARLLWVSEEEHLLFFMPHHIVFDGWSFDIVLAELKVGIEGTETSLPALPVSYADFADWQRQRLGDAAMAAGVQANRARLDGAPLVLDLATDRPRPAVRQGAGDWLPFALSPESASAMRALARATGTTPYMVLLSAFGAVLARMSGQDDLLIGTPVRGRDVAEVESLVGFFVNTLVVRLRAAATTEVHALLTETRTEVLGAMQHGEVPFDLLVRELDPPRDMSRTPLFQAFFSFQDVQNRQWTMGPAQVQQEILFPGSAATDLTFWVRDDGTSISGALEYDAALFDRWRIEALGRHVDSIVRRMAEAPEALVRDLAILDATDAEIDRVALGAPHESPPHADIVSHFAARVAAHPDRPAVTAGARTLSYRELWSLSGRVANGLLALGLPERPLVALEAARNEQLPALLLGCWRARAAYLPIDAEHPAERLQTTLAQAKVDLVITTESALPTGAATGARTIALADLLASSDEAPAETAGDDLAYVLTTSGSTGQPKQVEITHRALRWFLAAAGAALPIGEQDLLLAVTTLTFDIAMLELILPLLSGARVVIADSETSGDGRALAQLLSESGATVMQGTPSTWRMLLDDGWDGRLHTVLCGGEPLPRDLADALLQQAGTVWNLYGPTEATVWATVAQVAPSPAPVTIGRPLPWAWAAIVDDDMRPVVPGTPGELLLGGPGLARGYRHRDDLSAERFVPWRDAHGVAHRVYRTGDVARVRGSGEIEHLGRTDHQVKVRGFRVELGEVEETVARLPEVAQCVADVRPAPDGLKVLVAYVLFRPGRRLTGSDVRRHVQQRLPDYMVPSHIVAVESIPLTTNGKVDRRALPGPFGTTAAAARAITPPRTRTELVVAEVWRAILGVDALSREDNFFDRGGHSLMSLRAVIQLEKRLGARAPLALLLTGTLAELAAWFEAQPRP